MGPQNWSAIPEERLNARMTRRVIHAETMTLARLELAQGAIVPLHHHVNEQITTVQTGKLIFYMNGKEITVNAGEMLIIPPRLPHKAEAVEDSVAIDFFSPPREDWIRGDDAYLR